MSTHHRPLWQPSGLREKRPDKSKPIFPRVRARNPNPLNHMNVAVKNHPSHATMSLNPLT